MQRLDCLSKQGELYRLAVLTGCTSPWSSTSCCRTSRGFRAGLLRRNGRCGFGLMPVELETSWPPLLHCLARISTQVYFFFLRHIAEVSAVERGWFLKIWRLLQNDASDLSLCRPAGRENDNQSCQPGLDHGMKKRQGHQAVHTVSFTRVESVRDMPLTAGGGAGGRTACCCVTAACRSCQTRGRQLLWGRWVTTQASFHVHTNTKQLRKAVSPALSVHWTYSDRAKSAGEDKLQVSEWKVMKEQSGTKY